MNSVCVCVCGGGGGGGGGGGTKERQVKGGGRKRWYWYVGGPCQRHQCMAAKCLYEHRFHVPVYLQIECVCVCVCVCVLELCRRIRKRLRHGRLMSASLAHGSPSIYLCWTYLLPFAKTHLSQYDRLCM